MTSRTTPVTPRRVAVTAMGVVSPLGIGAAENLRALQAGRDAVTPVPPTRFDVGSCRAGTAGQLDEARLQAAASERTRPGKASRLHLAGAALISAVREALESDALFRPELMVIGTTSGGMSYGEFFFRGQIARQASPKRAGWLANYMPQKALLDASGAGGFSCPSQIIANACASGTNAIGHGFQLVRSGGLQRVLCGGYDIISELVFTGFDSLQAATPEKTRPFDKNRTGLVLGEGAAVLALEDLESARKRGAPILAEITGYGIATDNHHLTQPHPSGIGPLLAMRRALEDACCEPEKIDYVNAHGTATIFNDATEGLAIAQLFGSQVPVSSTKSMMGHALGAAGAIEAAFSILALQHHFLPPNINYAEKDPAWSLNIVANEARPASVARIISNSFGFGGANAAIVIQKAA